MTDVNRKVAVSLDDLDDDDKRTPSVPGDDRCAEERAREERMAHGDASAVFREHADAAVAKVNAARAAGRKEEADAALAEAWRLGRLAGNAHMEEWFNEVRRMPPNERRRRAVQSILAARRGFVAGAPPQREGESDAAYEARLKVFEESELPRRGTPEIEARAGEIKRACEAAAVLRRLKREVRRNPDREFTPAMIRLLENAAYSDVFDGLQIIHRSPPCPASEHDMSEDAAQALWIDALGRPRTEVIHHLNAASTALQSRFPDAPLGRGGPKGHPMDLWLRRYFARAWLLSDADIEQIRRAEPRLQLYLVKRSRGASRVARQRKRRR